MNTYNANACSMQATHGTRQRMSWPTERPMRTTERRITKQRRKQMLTRVEVVERVVLLIAVIVLMCDVIFWRP